MCACGAVGSTKSKYTPRPKVRVCGAVGSTKSKYTPRPKLCVCGAVGSPKSEYTPRSKVCVCVCIYIYIIYIYTSTVNGLFAFFYMLPPKSLWYNRNGWLGGKHQVTTIPPEKGFGYQLMLDRMRSVIYLWTWSYECMMYDCLFFSISRFPGSQLQIGICQVRPYKSLYLHHGPYKSS